MAIAKTMVKIATILGVHGKRGKLKLLYDIDYNELKKVLLQGSVFFESGVKCELHFINVSVTGKENIAIASLQLLQIDDRSDSFYNNDNLQQYAKVDLFCNRNEFKSSLIVNDLIGLDVYIKKAFKKYLYGRIIGLYNFGAGDVVEIVIDNPDSSNEQNEKLKNQKGNKTIMYLFSDKNFTKINLKKRYAILDKEFADSGISSIAN
ncbi:MAG: hypothetical protein JJW01_00895 [Alphaproteobacteria bacterium]|nr:hypothetical protein [Rickettsiales bacterium]